MRISKKPTQYVLISWFFPCWTAAQNNSVRVPIMTFCIVTEDPPTYQICPVLATLRKDNKSDIWWSTWLFQHHQWWYTKPLSFINLYRRVRKWLSSPLLRTLQPSQRQIKQKSPFLCNKYKIDASFPNLMNQIIVLTPIPSNQCIGTVGANVNCSSVNGSFVTIFPSCRRESSNFNLLYVWWPASHLQDKWARKGSLQPGILAHKG